MKLVCNRNKKQHYHDLESGRDFFSVSQIRAVMWDGFAKVPADVLEAASRRGRILHHRFALALYARAGICPYPEVIQEFAGQCRAMDEWMEKNNVRPLKVEEASANLEMGFAGQPDAKVLYGKKEIITGIDAKFGDKTPTDTVQCLAYGKMQGYQDVTQWMDLRFHKETGEAQEEWIKPSPIDWAAFINALSLLRWRASL